MNHRFLTITLLCLVSFSCDKAKYLANRAKSTVENQIAKQTGQSGDSKPDPELQKLVDQTPDGVIFRKDLAFPSHLEVKITRSNEISGRGFQSSAIGSQASVVKGTQTTVTKFERAGDQVRYTLEQSTFAEPVAKDADESAKPAVKELAPPSKPVVFKKSGSTWKSDDSESFSAAALSKQMAPVFDQLLVEAAAAPRGLWFGKKRVKVGDQITVADKSLPMLVAGNVAGSLKLTLESFESVAGHPCGVFTVTGDYGRKQFPDFDGKLTDEDVAIQSGKLWLSLIYPLILREETDTIQTHKSGAQGDMATRIQGSVKISVNREWKKL